MTFKLHTSLYIFLLVLFIKPCYAAGGKSPDDSLKAVLDKAGTDTARIKILYNYSPTISTTDPEKALKYLAQALEMSNKIHYSMGRANSIFYTGSVYLAKSDYKEALKYYLKAVLIHDSLHKYKNVAYDYGYIAFALEQEKYYEQAISYYKKSIAYARQSGYDDGLFRNLRNMARAFELKGDLDSSEFYKLQALDQAKKMKNEQYTVSITADLGILAAFRKKYKEALAYYMDALPWFMEHGDPLESGFMCQNICGVNAALKDYPEARKYAKMGYDILINVKIPDARLRFYQSSYENYKEMGDYQEALKWHEKLKDLNDSIFNSTATKQMAEMATRFETGKKEEQIKAQKSELELKNELLFVGIVLGILILAAAGFSFYSYRKSQKLSRNLASQKEKLEDLNTVKDKLFSIISHDLRSPLVNSLSLLELLKRGNISEEKFDRYSNALAESLQQNIELLDNLLNWAASQIRGLQINKKEIAVKELIEENLYALKTAAEKKNISLVDIAKDDARIVADLSMARLILRNLLSNAVKFTPEGGTITLSSMQAGGSVKISVQDTGVGMDEQTRKSVFSQPVAESKPGTKNEKGFGIGLQLCREFVEKNGGTLTVESEPGKGSTFSFTLPKAA